MPFLLRTKTVYGLLMFIGWLVLSAFTDAASTTAAQDAAALEQEHRAIVESGATGPGTYVADYDTGASLNQNNNAPVVVEIPPLPVRPAHLPWNQRGVFLTPTSIGSNDFRSYTMEHLRETGGNAIVFDVKGSSVHFHAANMPLAEKLGLLQPKYELGDVVRILHEHGIYAIARYIAIKDHSLTAALPDTHLKDPRTGQNAGEGWIDPAHPDALEYNRQIICALAEGGVDEINLDYIRYDTRVGTVISAYTDEERIAKIETFIRMAREAINECGPQAKLGVSTFAILGWDYDGNVGYIGQDILRFAPMLDVISPMAYNANFDINKWGDPTGKTDRWQYLVQKTVEGYREALGSGNAWKVRPWLQGWGVDVKEMRLQMKGVFEGGACGFIVWNADNGYSPAYDAMERIDVPDSCKPHQGADSAAGK